MDLYIEYTKSCMCVCYVHCDKFLKEQYLIILYISGHFNHVSVGVVSP